MKVLHVINNLTSGGAEKIVTDLCVSLKQRNTDVEVLLLTTKNDKDNFHLNKIREHNIPVYFTDIKGRKSIKQMLKIRKVIKTNKFDIINVHLFSSQIWTWLALFFLRDKPKVLVTEHTTNNKRDRYMLFTLIEKIMYKSYEKVICISESIRDYVINKFPNITDKTLVIYNGIDINKFKSENRLKNFTINKNPKTIIKIARFSHHKDYVTVIKAFNSIKNKTDYKLILVGEGEQQENIKELVAKLQLTKYIEFAGIRDDIPLLLKNSDLLVFSSFGEGFGLAAVEGMAAGLPVLLSDVDGLNNLTDDKMFFFKLGDYNQLCKKIQLILNNEEIYGYMSKKSEQISANFSIQSMTDKYIELYNKCM